jgi:hypothetical protein
MSAVDKPSGATVWIFHGEHARFASGVFTTMAAGLDWAATHRVTGILAEYAIGGAYDLAVGEGRFRPSKAHHGTPRHVAGFGPGLAHVHLTEGRRDQQDHDSREGSGSPVTGSS